MDLRYKLVLQTVATAAACLLAVAAAVLWRSDRALDRDLRDIAEIGGRLIEGRLLERSLGYAGNTRGDDIAQLLEPAMAVGLCLHYQPTEDRPPVVSCRGWDSDGGQAPSWFRVLRGHWPGSASRIERPLRVQGRPAGTLSVLSDADHQAALAWHDLAPMLGLTVLTLLLLSVTIAWTLGRALRPAQQLLDTLTALERGDLARRAPPMQLREFERIGSGLNRMAASLQRALADRAELSARLVRVQEDERRHLARELHDELGQCLTGIQAMAAVIIDDASRDCPKLVPQARRIAGITARMMEVLGSMLTRLRPPELDAAGLTAALTALVADGNRFGKNASRARLSVDGAIDSLPEPLPVTLYRLVQEALTNAARHAGAQRVTVRLIGTPKAIHIEIDDDGASGVAQRGLIPGRGLNGMRERLDALGGTLWLGPSEAGGLALRANIPVPTAAETTR